MKRSKRLWWIAAIALAAVVLITLIAAPSNNKLSIGSTYSRAPEGYGAWYSFMQQQGTPVKRWQKPFEDLVKAKQPITLLRVSSQQSFPILNSQEQEWLKKGNTLVILGVWEPVTEVAFSTWQESYVGTVKIDTRRRQKVEGKQKLLGDRYGAVVWREQLGKGQVIYSTTRNLAANAYQDYPGNYKYLAQLVKKSGSSVWVDEYVHGYKDIDARQSAGERNGLSYLAQKPIFPALLQLGILLLVLIWAHNRRLGQPQALDTPVVDNSVAYVQALAGVLQKADKSDFVLNMIGSSEQMQLQQALGLGQIPLERQTLVQAWVQQTGRTPAELEQILRLSQKSRMSDKDLSIWLEKWKSIRTYAKPN